MAKNALIQKRFDGGWSPDAKIGQPNTFAYSRCIDFRKKPSSLSVLPGATTEGDGVIVDLIQNTVMDLTGKIYGLGNTGWFYRRQTTGVWSSEGKLDSAAFGLSFRSDVDKLFIATNNAISEYSPVSNNPTLHIDKYGQRASTDSGATLSGGTLLYTLPTTLSETITNKQEFTSDIEPLTKVRIQVADGGTGDWTMVIHDAANNELGSSTVLNADITDNKYLDFDFSQIRLYIKPNARTYHFHLTSTVADGSCKCSSPGNLNTADFTVYADRLIETTNGMHPMMTFLQYELIGNANYLAVWEPLSDEPSNAEFLAHKLRFPAGLEVCGITRWQEYAAIACESAEQGGYIFFWDGLSSTYNFFVSVPEGSPYSIDNYKDVLKYIAGGDEYAYTGGAPYKIRSLPNTDSEYSDATDTTVTYPYMSTVRRGVHLQAWPSYTTNEAIEHGVYSWGASNKDFSESFGYSYVLSTGTRYNTSGNLRIGHVKNYGDTLFISWRDGSEYGLDKIDNSSDPATTAVWESLFTDNGKTHRPKTGERVLVTFDPLPSDVTINVKYRTSRNGAWTYSEDFTSANTPDNEAVLPISPTRYREIQYGFEVTITGSETPVITSVVLVYDDTRDEKL